MWSYKHYKIHCYFANITVFHTACRKTVIDDLISVVPYKIVFWIPKTICDDITKNENSRLHSAPFVKEGYWLNLI